MVNISDEIR